MLRTWQINSLLKFESRTKSPRLVTIGVLRKVARYRDFAAPKDGKNIIVFSLGASLF